jgi:hypothetical protein
MKSIDTDHMTSRDAFITAMQAAAADFVPVGGTSKFFLSRSVLLPDAAPVAIKPYNASKPPPSNCNYVFPTFPMGVYLQHNSFIARKNKTPAQKLYLAKLFNIGVKDSSKTVTPIFGHELMRDCGEFIAADVLTIQQIRSYFSTLYKKSKGKAQEISAEDVLGGTGVAQSDDEREPSASPAIIDPGDDDESDQDRKPVKKSRKPVAGNSTSKSAVKSSISRSTPKSATKSALKSSPSNSSKLVINSTTATTVIAISNHEDQSTVTSTSSHSMLPASLLTTTPTSKRKTPSKSKSIVAVAYDDNDDDDDDIDVAINSIESSVSNSANPYSKLYKPKPLGRSRHNM